LSDAAKNSGPTAESNFVYRRISITRLPNPTRFHTTRIPEGIDRMLAFADIVFHKCQPTP
jgi:hypothetical protein